MLLKDLLTEMPVLFKQELKLDDEEKFSVFFLTDQNIDRLKYKIIGKKNNVTAFLKESKSIAIVGVKETRHDGASGYRILGQIEFKKPNLGVEIPNHQDTNLLQISLVEVTDEFRSLGLGSFLYHCLVKSGFSVISDNAQYSGGKALWMKIVKSKLSNEAVYIIDKGEMLSDEDGNPIEYDGKNIPEERIWGDRHHHVLLVYNYVKN